MYQNKRTEMVFLCRESNERRSERPTIIIWFTNTTAILLIAHTSYEMHLLHGEENYEVKISGWTKQNISIHWYIFTVNVSNKMRYLSLKEILNIYLIWYGQCWYNLWYRNDESPLPARVDFDSKSLTTWQRYLIQVVS